MDIVTRQQAISYSLTRYFTGIPCKNGHTAERYTRCSVCVDCLHPKIQNSGVTRRVAMRAVFRMIRIKVVLHKDDVEAFVASAHFLAVSREPSITPDDLLTKFSPRVRAVDTYLHAFKCFPEDAGALYRLAEDLSFVRLTPAQQQLVRDAASRRIS